MDHITIISTCPQCQTRGTLKVKASDYVAWREQGVLIQNAFPYLSADEREMLMSGLCPVCWDRMFAD